MTAGTKRICLWSGPRNISTALMYSFAQRPDTLVYDEPLYAHYLSKSPAKDYHPGAQEVIDSQDNDGEKVIAHIVLGRQEKPVAFFKMMTHHLVQLKLSFLAETLNVILIRDPKEVLPSFVNQVKKPQLKDVGYKQSADLFEYLKSIGRQPLVLDARFTLLNPQTVLQKLCALLEISFFDSMLSWKAGPRKEDGVWAKHWYHNVHTSSGFMSYRAKKEPFPSELLNLLNQCEPYYEKLKQYAIRG